jgi:glutathione S-transferase
MRLYYAAASPFVRKVLVLLHETGQLGDVEIVDVATSPVATDKTVKASNPLGKIPALERGHGPTLYDSRVICEFLNELAGADLYAGGWDTKVLEATADGLMDATVLMSYELRLRPEEKRWDDWTEGQRAKALGACSAINDRWMPMMRGPLNIGQIAVACALGYADFRHPSLGWRDRNTALAEWYADFESRGSMQATLPPEN